MKKIIMIGCLVISANASYFVEDFSENSRIQGYINLDKKIDNVNLNINKEDYIDKLEKKEIEMSPFKILEENKKVLSREFEFKNASFNYKFYLNKITFKLPEEKILILVKKITEEEGEQLIFRDLVKAKLINDCKELKNKKIKLNNLFVKAKKGEEIGVKITSEMQNLRRSLSSKKCMFESLTNNEQEKLLNTIKKKALKAIMIRNMYLLKDKTLKELEVFLKFYKSTKYQDFFSFKKGYTLDLLIPKIKIEEELSIKEDKKIKKDIKKISAKDQKLNNIINKRMNKKFDKKLEKMEASINNMKITTER